MALSTEEKEKLKQKRIANLRRGRETKKDRMAAATAEGAKQEVLLSQTGKVKPDAGSGNGDKLVSLKAKSLVVKRRTLRDMLFISAGIVLFVLGIGQLVIGNMGQNAVLIVVGALMSAGGGFAVYRGWSQSSIILSSKKSIIKQANILNINAATIGFAYEENESCLVGTPQKCLNDGKYYYVFIAGPNGNGSKSPLLLPDLDPDERHYDPREAINCLRMELVRRFVNYLPSSTQVVSMVVVGVVIGLEIIGLIALGG